MNRVGSSAPLFSVIDSTTPTLSIPDAVAIYRRAGVQGIGITQSSTGDVEADAHIVHAGGLTVTGCFLETASILPPVAGPASSAYGLSRPDLRTPRSRLDDMVAAMQRLVPFHPAFFYALTGPLGEHTEAEAWAIVVAGLRELSEVASALGAAIAVEVFHPSLEEWSFVNSIPGGVDLLDDVARPNVALAVDVWHLCDGAEMLEHVREHATRAVSLHVNDRRQPTRSIWDRVLPGDGVADIKGILKSLDEGGFRGWFELEILSDDGRVEEAFSDSLWARDPLEVVTLGRSQFLALWDGRNDP
jgi:sugar phosphate isomerase/epimerase